MDCIYCGMPANTKDHVIPYSYLRNSKRRNNCAPSVGQVVDCCAECNNLLGSKALFSVPERANEIAVCLERRYRKELNAPYWSEEEINELGPSLKKQVKAKQFLREEVLERIRQAIGVASGLQEAALPLHSIL